MKTSLQNRLIILMALVSAFLISAFTAIQLYNNITKAHEFSIFKAKEGAFVVMRSLKDLFAQEDATTSKDHVVDEVKNLFSDLHQTGMFETAVLLDENNVPVVIDGNLKLFFEEDQTQLRSIRKRPDKTRWLIPKIDKKHKVGSLFIAIENPYGFIVKLSFSFADLDQALKEVYQPAILTVLIVILGNIILSVLLSRIIIVPIKLFNKATKDIAGGNLDLKVSMNTKDELEELSDTFNFMTNELRKMKARAENANPLTKLPGNIIIQEEAENRIKEDKKFVLIYTDLDNFKAFNDKFGFQTGDKIILLTADILREAIEKKGVLKEDFLGHGGGDDFLLLVGPERADDIADYIISEFNTRVKTLYPREDVKRGYFEARTRDGLKIKKYPLASISLVGVGNVTKKISSYAHLTNIAAELKEKVKESEGSLFIMDQRVENKGTEFRKEDI